MKILNNTLKGFLSFFIAIFIISFAIAFVILFRPYYYWNIGWLDLENQTGYTYEEKAKHIADVLSFNRDDIKAFIPVFEAFKNSPAECSVGNGANQTNYGKFDEIINL